MSNSICRKLISDGCGNGIFLKLFISLCAVIVCILLLGPVYFKDIYVNIYNMYISPKVSMVEPKQCPGVLSLITDGHWSRRTLTPDEDKRIYDWLRIARSHYGVPASMERKDGVCGTDGFPGLKSHPALKFRALCDPIGPHPCCEDFKCVNRSISNCHCPNCYDVRNQIHAEYSKWVPKGGCTLRNYTSTEACGILGGAELQFIGDSYLRQMYVMIINHITGNYIDSALAPNTPLSKRKMYSGPFQLLCYGYLAVSRVLCNNTVVNHAEVITPAPQYVIGLATKLKNKPRSLILLGQGIHGGYERFATWNIFLKPLVQLYNKTQQKWPKILWITPHAHGILKIPRNINQNDSNLEMFNEFISKNLKESNFSVFDTLPMTRGVMAYDGAHYGQGINMMKIQVVYNYLQELKDRGQW